ncbi:MAG: ABC transporter ATP-binding protein [Pseudanabaenaceae cyanobacterium SKYGB_i_bin29]|nr:ABC transporter ATP-binding protein [Pseudanabaenaceae cyanobacterium SKYG29]MDW8420517.1 ABC transporter ATP-binding protein [Pseudanabaenaceae cyanobacterium SKYGB_i_bin29]
MLLDVQNLAIAFDGKTVVQDLSFSLDRGESLGIVGESGSGKSATALAIMGLLPANGKVVAGSIELDGTNLLTAKENYRGKRIGMIFQEPMSSLNPLFTCGYQIREAILQHQNVTARQAEEQVISLLQEVQLPASFAKRYPHQISGGQVQRVMIAMALAGNPDLLIADEPTTALDVTVQATILELLNNLRRSRSMSLIFISHDLGVVKQVSDKLVVMYRGRCVESGTTQEVFNKPRHPYTRGLLACRPRPHLRLLYLPTVQDYMTETADGKIIPKIPDNPLLGVPAPAYEMPAGIAPLLQVEGLSVSYIKQTYALEDVGFEVFPGETLGIVGESGSGKTTLARAIVGLISPQRGKIIFQNQLLGKSRPRSVRRQMQMVFQDPVGSLNPKMTIGAALEEPLIIHGVYRTREERRGAVVELLRKVGLDADAMSRYPHAFSGGQKQRISIARALILRPSLVIADEAVSALDVSVQAQVLNLLKSLQKEFQLTYIFISHDLSVVKFMSDRMVVMCGGRIVEQGLADQIYQQPQAEYTRQLLRSIPA